MLYVCINFDNFSFSYENALIFSRGVSYPIK